MINNSSLRNVSLADKINISIAILTLLSVLASWQTVIEMKNDRNITYQPVILLNPISYSFEWDSGDREPWVPDLVYDSYPEAFIASPPSDFFVNLQAANIGFSPGRNVKIVWAKDNIQELIDILTTFDTAKTDFCTIHPDYVSFKYPNGLIQVHGPEDTEFMYMLPSKETEELYIVPIPQSYIILINEIIKTTPYRFESESIRFLEFAITSTDIREKVMTEKDFNIHINIQYFSEDPNGSGNATYTINPHYQ